jgi:cell division transport system permease protein
VSYALREAAAAFRRAPVLTGLAAAMVALALFVVGLFGIVAHNLEVALEEIESRVEVVAYLLDDALNREIELAVSELQALPQVASVVYVSKDSALMRARRDLAQFEEVFSGLAVNPLPASLEVRLREGSRNRQAVDRVAEVASAFPFVEDVAYGREWVDRLFNLRRVAGISSAVLGGAFALVAALIIATALRIAIFARRDEIYIMRLVGARDGFIGRPFLLEGAVTGLLGGVLAIVLTWVAWRTVDRLLFRIEWIPAAWIGLGLVAGALFGALASTLAVRRHLREVA